MGEVVAALGGEAHQPAASLRRYLERDFFKWHAQLYRKRPICWLLQSPRRSYGLYLFHERATRDTLYLVQGGRYLGGKINQTRLRAEDLAAQAQSASGGERRRLEREREQALALLAELEGLAKALRAVTDAQDERGETVGWKPQPDDGVILNLAPLHALLPAWPAEPRRSWERLAAGDYDWSAAARRYWPDRVAAKCRTSKSYAIAHGCLELYEEPAGSSAAPRQRSG